MSRCHLDKTMAYASKNLKVSVVIRTRNIERHFFRLLEKLSYQTLKPSEIIVVNNFSSEKELKNLNDALSNVMKKYFDNQIPIKLIPISDSEFSHPYSTNMGVSAANNELVCITNGHSLPTSIFWLASGIKHFRNPSVAGVSGYFISYKDGSIWEKISYDLIWPTVNGIGKKARRKEKYFSTINCIIRKSLWKEYPFDENLPKILPQNKRLWGSGEDYDWGQEMMARGYKVVLEPRFNVYHSHGQTLPGVIAKNLTCYGICKKIDSFKRPRKSYTRLKATAPYVY